MESSRPCDEERVLRETHRILSNVHGVLLGIIDSCAEFRFEVVDADNWFERITGGRLADLETSLADLRDWAQKAHLNVRRSLDRIEEEDDGE